MSIDSNAPEAGLLRKSTLREHLRWRHLQALNALSTPQQTAVLALAQWLQPRSWHHDTIQALKSVWGASVARAASDVNEVSLETHLLRLESLSAAGLQEVLFVMTLIVLEDDSDTVHERFLDIKANIELDRSAQEHAAEVAEALMNELAQPFASTLDCAAERRTWLSTLIARFTSKDDWMSLVSALHSWPAEELQDALTLLGEPLETPPLSADSTSGERWRPAISWWPASWRERPELVDFINRQCPDATWLEASHDQDLGPLMLRAPAGARAQGHVISYTLLENHDAGGALIVCAALHDWKEVWRREVLWRGLIPVEATLSISDDACQLNIKVHEDTFAYYKAGLIGELWWERVSLNLSDGEIRFASNEPSSR